MGIKLKMTLWYTILALVTAGLMGGLLFIAAQRSAYEYYSDTLHAASALAQSQLCLLYTSRNAALSKTRGFSTV